LNRLVKICRIGIYGEGQMGHWLVNPGVPGEMAIKASVCM